MEAVRLPQTRRQLYLEHLEQRVLLNVNLGPGDWTYFDIADTGPSGKDYFIGLSTDSTGSVRILAAEGGTAAPTGIQIIGSGKIDLLVHGDVPVITDLSGGNIELNIYHANVTVNASWPGGSPAGPITGRLTCAGLQTSFEAPQRSVETAKPDWPGTGGGYGGTIEATGNIGGFSSSYSGTLSGVFSDRVAGGGNIGAIYAPNMYLEDFYVFAKSTFDTEPGNVGLVTAYGWDSGMLHADTWGGLALDYGGLGYLSAVELVATRADSIFIRGDIYPMDAPQWIPEVGTMTVWGTAYNVWIMGRADTVAIQDAGYLTIGGFAPWSGSGFDARYTVGSLKIGDVGPGDPYGNVFGQLWLWGDVNTIDINNGFPGFDLGNAKIFVDGTITGHLDIDASSDSIHVGMLAENAYINVGRFLAAGSDPDLSQAGSWSPSYIFISGPSGEDGFYRIPTDTHLDGTNLISLGNNEFRLFSLGSLGDARIETGDFYLTDITWDTTTRDLFDPDTVPGTGLSQVFQVVPEANPGSGFANGQNQHSGIIYSDVTGRLVWASTDGWEPYSDGIACNYYYRGFRVMTDANAAYRKPGYIGEFGQQTYAQEFLTIKDSHRGVYPSGSSRQLPQVAFEIDQGRMLDITLTTAGRGVAGQGGDSAGIESSITLFNNVNVVGNLSFLYVHGDADYRGDIKQLTLTSNSGNYGDITGAWVAEYFTTLTTGADPISADPRHILINNDEAYSGLGGVELSGTNLFLNGILGVYARNGRIGNVQVMNGNVAGDIVSDYGGIDLVEIHSNIRSGQPHGLYGTILARTDTGNIARVRADSAYAQLISTNTSDDPLGLLGGGGARIVAEGKLGIEADRSGFAGAASSPLSDWAVWIGKGNLAGDSEDGFGYVHLIRGSSDSARTRIHAEVNDVWTIDINGNDGFGVEDRIDLPYDNDLFLQVAIGLNWDPSTRNDFTRDARGYPTVNHVLLGEYRSGVNAGIGDSNRSDWSLPGTLPGGSTSIGDVAVARRFVVRSDYEYNLYFFNEGDISAAAGIQTYDGDTDRIEFIQYTPVGGNGVVDQYLYKGQIDRIEYISGPTGRDEGIATVITTKAFVDEGQAGFNYYGRILATGANALVVAAEGQIREVRASNGRNVVGTEFGFTWGGFSADGKVLGYLALGTTYAVDWDNDGDRNDATAVISFRGAVNQVTTTGTVSTFAGDVVTASNSPIRTVDVVPTQGAQIDIVSGGDVENVNIRGAGGRTNVIAAGRLLTIRTAGDFTMVSGSTAGVSTVINATGNIREVQITAGVWEGGDRLVSGGSDVFFVSKDGFSETNPGQVVLTGIAADFARAGGIPIIGNPPDIVYIVDISGSTWGTFEGTPVGDVNGDGWYDTILDAELEFYIRLTQAVQSRYGSNARIGIVTFDEAAYQIDMDPVARDMQYYTTSTADNDGDGVADVIQILQNIGSGGATNYEDALTKAMDTLTRMGTTPGNGNVFFLSDGYPNVGGDHADEAATLNGMANNVRAFGVGLGADLTELIKIDPDAIIFTSTDQMFGLLSEQRTFTLQDMDRAGVGRYYYVSERYAALDRYTNLPGLAEVTLDSQGMNDEAVLDFFTEDGVLNTIAIEESQAAGAVKPSGVARAFTITCNDRLNALSVVSDPSEANVQPFRVDELVVGAADVYLSAANAATYDWNASLPGLETKLVLTAPDPDPYTFSVLLDSLSFSPGSSAYNHVLFTQGSGLGMGDIALTASSVSSLLMNVTISESGGVRYPSSLAFTSAGNVFALTVASNTDLGAFSTEGSLTDLVVRGGVGTVGSVNVGGVIMDLHANTITGSLRTDAGIQNIHVQTIGGGLTLGGASIVLGGIDVYGDVTLLPAVRQVINEGGSFYGSIYGSFNINLPNGIELIKAKSFGSPGSIHNVIQTDGSLVSLIAEEDIYAVINVTGNIWEIRAGGNIAGGITAGGFIGTFGAVGTSHPSMDDVVELDGQKYTHDDVATGVVAGGSIAGSITAGGSIAVIKSGGDLGKRDDWVSSTFGSLNRNLITANGSIGAIVVGGNMYSRVNVIAPTNGSSTLDYVIVYGDLMSAARKGALPTAGDATLTTSTGDPILFASQIGIIGVRGDTYGANVIRWASSQVMEYPDDRGETQVTAVTGSNGGSADLAFGQIVRMRLGSAGGKVYSSGDLGFVTSTGNVSVYTGAVRKWRVVTDPLTGATTNVRTADQWVTPFIKGSSIYGYVDDVVLTTQRTAGVLSVESLRGNVTQVVSNGPVGSVVAHAGSVGKVWVVDNTLGLVVAGEEITTASELTPSSVYGRKGVSQVLVLSATGTQNEFGVVTPISGNRSTAPALKASVESSGTIGEVSVERIGAGAHIQAVKNIRDVQVVYGTGLNESGLYNNYMRPTVLTTAGSISSVLVGSPYTGKVPAGQTAISYITSDCLVDVIAQNGNIGTVTATGNLLSNIGDAALTRNISKVTSLGGSIGRGDLIVVGNSAASFIPTIAAAGKVNLVYSQGDIFVHVDAGSVGTLRSYAGRIGSAETLITVAGAINMLSGGQGIGAAITTGGNVSRVEVLGGVFSGSLNVGGTLNNFTATGSGASSVVTGPITADKGIGTLAVRNGALAGTVTVLNGSINTLRVDNLMFTGLSGTVNTPNGAIRNATISGNLTGAINSGLGIGSLTVNGRLSGLVNVIAGDLGKLKVSNSGATAINGVVTVSAGSLNSVDVAGDVTGASITANIGAIGNVRIRGSYTDSDLIAQTLRSVVVDGTIRDLGGAQNRIRAVNAASAFTIQDATRKTVVDMANNHLNFGGVDVYVGV